MLPSNIQEPENCRAASVSQIERRSLRHCRYATTPLHSDRRGIFPRRKRSSLHKGVKPCRSDQSLSSPPLLQHSASAHRHSRRATAGYPITAECRHITTRAGGTSAARPRRKPHSPHHSRNLQGLATACTYSPAEGSPASRIPSPARKGPPSAGTPSDQVLQNDWFWGGLRY